MRWLLLIALLLFAPLVQAQGWISPCPGDSASSCYDFTGSTDSALKYFSAAATTMCLDPDIASTTGVATAYIRQCVSCTSASTNTCETVLVDQDGAPGVDNLPLNGNSAAARRCLYALPPGCYYVDVETSAGGVTARLRAEGK